MHNSTIATTATTTTTATTPLPSMFAAPTGGWLDAIAGPNHGRRLSVRVLGLHLDTEVTLGRPWRQVDGTVSRSLHIAALTRDGRTSRRLPAISGEVSATADDRVRCTVDAGEARAGVRRWVMRHAARAVLAQLTAAATTGRSSTASTSSWSSGTTEVSRSVTRCSPTWNESIPARTA